MLGGMPPIHLPKSGLLVVDAQRGFSTLCPAELPVPGALEIVPNVNRLLALPWRRIDATQDWHPANHRSFLGQKDNLYPPHCVFGSAGADFLPGLDTHRFHAVWRKCFAPDFESYSVVRQHPGLPALLQFEGIDTVVVCGLTTNICVFQTARDLRRANLRVFIAEDACAGVDVPRAGFYRDQAKAEGQALGIEYVKTDAVIETTG